MDNLASLTLSGVGKHESVGRKHTRKSASGVRKMHIHKADSGYVVHTEHHHKQDDGSESIEHQTEHAPDSDALHDLVEQHMGEPAEGEDEIAGMPSGQQIQQPS